MSAVSKSTTTDKRSHLLDASRELLQTRGLNAFSHRDLAQRVGIKSSSVHYHFPTKSDIGIALMRRYRADVQAFFEGQAACATARARLGNFFQLFEQTAQKGDELCLAGMLASDYQTLSQSLKLELRYFFSLVESWLATQAQEMAPQRSAAASQVLGRLALALLEGALLSSRVFGETQRVSQAGEAILLMFEHRL
jgi:TetR/AcrR family transcriptional repressor of nem operon